MTGRLFLIISIVTAMAFLAGWFLHQQLRPSTCVNEAEQQDAVADNSSKTGIIGNNKLATSVSGRFILTEANCAGLNFINDKLVLWTNEIACHEPDTLAFRWLSDSIFMTRTTFRHGENCPPGVDIYKVVSYDGKRLALKSVWTGWNDSEDMNLELIKQGD